MQTVKKPLHKRGFLSRYFKLLKPVWGTFLLGLAINSIFGILSGGGVPVVLEKYAPNSLREGDASMAVLIKYIIPVAIILLARAIFGFIGKMLMAKCSQDIVANLRYKIFLKIQNLPLAYFYKKGSSNAMVTVLNDTRIVEGFLWQTAGKFISHTMSFLSCLGAIGYLSFKHPGIIPAYGLVIMTIPVIFIIRTSSRKLRKNAKFAQKNLKDIIHKATESLSVIREIRSLNLERQQEKIFEKSILSYKKTKIVLKKYSMISAFSMDLVLPFLVAGMIIYAYKINLEFNTIASLTVIVFAFVSSIKFLLDGLAGFQIAEVSFDRINSILTETEVLKDPKNPASVQQLQGKICFENVNFSYEKIPALRDIQIELKAHKSYAIVGPSGAGKTTFINLIPRFFELTEGRITIDNIDINAMRAKDLRDNIALVSQNPVLFPDTLYNNIAMGKLGASRAAVEAAAKAAFAHEFITKLPDGYESHAGSGGAQLSGGQRQRIVLARALIKDAPILILDEATSDLDSQSEAKIQEVIQSLQGQKTILMVTHRFSSIKSAECILVFNDGRIVESGTHQDLIQRKGLFYGLYQRQTLDGVQQAKPSRL